MSKQQIRLELAKSGEGTVAVAVSGLAPISVTRKGKSACRPAGGDRMRVRTIVDEATADQLLLAQELFSGAMKERWSDWFSAASEDVLDDASEPVVAINRRGERTVTLLAEGTWPDDEDEVSVRLTSAVFDGTGLAVIWTVRSTKPPAPEPVPEPEPVVEAEPAPLAEKDAKGVDAKEADAKEVDAKGADKRLWRAQKAKKNDKRAKAIAAAVAAALNFDTDSDADEA